MFCSFGSSIYVMWPFGDIRWPQARRAHACRNMDTGVFQMNITYTKNLRKLFQMVAHTKCQLVSAYNYIRFFLYCFVSYIRNSTSLYRQIILLFTTTVSFVGCLTNKVEARKTWKNQTYKNFVETSMCPSCLRSSDVTKGSHNIYSSICFWSLFKLAK